MSVIRLAPEHFRAVRDALTFAAGPYAPRDMRPGLSRADVFKAVGLPQTPTGPEAEEEAAANVAAFVSALDRANEAAHRVRYSRRHADARDAGRPDYDPAPRATFDPFKRPEHLLKALDAIAYNCIEAREISGDPHGPAVAALNTLAGDLAGSIVRRGEAYTDRTAATWAEPPATYRSRERRAEIDRLQLA